MIERPVPWADLHFRQCDWNGCFVLTVHKYCRRHRIEHAETLRAAIAKVSQR